MAQTPRGPAAGARAAPDDEFAQLQRRLDEQILERAEADPQWRQQFIEDPKMTIGDIPEGRQLLEMLERARPIEQPTKATMPPAREEYLQLRRSLAEKMLDRAASDPLWKQQLLDDPDTALRTANFPETQAFDEILQSAGAAREAEAEVLGHINFKDPRYALGVAAVMVMMEGGFAAPAMAAPQGPIDHTKPQGTQAGNPTTQTGGVAGTYTPGGADDKVTD